MKLPTLFLPEYPSDLFTWYKDKGVAELSDFGPLMNIGNLCSLVWIDSTDLAFNVKSTRTGAVWTFFYECELREEDLDHELYAWRFRTAENEFVIDILND